MENFKSNEQNKQSQTKPQVHRYLEENESQEDTESKYMAEATGHHCPAHNLPLVGKNKNKNINW